MEKVNEKKAEIGNSKGVRGGGRARTSLCLTKMAERGRLESRVFYVVLRLGLVLELRGDNSPIKRVQTHFYFLRQTKGEGSPQA